MPPIEDIEDGTNTARQRRERSMPSINEEGEDNDTQSPSEIELANAEHLDHLESSDQIDDIASFQDIELPPAPPPDADTESVITEETARLAIGSYPNLKLFLGALLLAFITVHGIIIACSSSSITYKSGVRGDKRPVFMNDNDNGHSNSNNKKINSADKLVDSSNDYNLSSRDDGWRRTPPKYIFLLGERNSGTNYIEKLLMTSFYPKYNATDSTTNHPFAVGIPIFGFKHMFRHSLLSIKELGELRQRQDILWIFAVRNPCDWADGMYRKPWHMCLPSDPVKCKSVDHGLDTNLLKNVSRASFFRDMPWWDWPETRSSKSKNFTYPTIFDLRSHKLRLMQQVIVRRPLLVSSWHRYTTLSYHLVNGLTIPQGNSDWRLMQKQEK